MSEQIQVREGVWLTREGEEIEVRARDVIDINTEWRWEGKRRGHYNTWRDDGTIHIEREQKEGDLVKFLRPLPGTAPEPAPEPTPEPQTTTDTLAEIEEQTCDTLHEALAQALEQAYIADLKKAVDAVTADRDRLQQAHQAMTEHAAELLESAQQARDQRDLLAQKLVTKPSEEALQKQVGKQQIEINTLKDKLQDMTSERDEIATELRAMTDHCEQQREKLQATTADRDRLQAEVANAQRLSADLRGEADFVRTQKTAQEHELRAANARLERELRDARIALDAEGETPATNRRAIADAHLVGAQTGRQAAFEAVERWVEVLDGVDSELAAAVLQALPGCIRRLAEREGVTL